MKMTSSQYGYLNSADGDDTGLRTSTGQQRLACEIHHLVGSIASRWPYTDIRPLSISGRGLPRFRLEEVLTKFRYAPLDGQWSVYSLCSIRITIATQRLDIFINLGSFVQLVGGRGLA